MHLHLRRIRSVPTASWNCSKLLTWSIQPTAPLRLILRNTTNQSWHWICSCCKIALRFVILLKRRALQKTQGDEKRDRLARPRYSVVKNYRHSEAGKQVNPEWVIEKTDPTPSALHFDAYCRIGPPRPQMTFPIHDDSSGSCSQATPFHICWCLWISYLRFALDVLN